MKTPASSEDLGGIIAEFAASLRCAHTRAIVVAGSAVSGSPTPWSDIDFAHIVDEAYTGPSKKFCYRGGRLFSVNARIMGWWHEALQRPERAIFTVPAMRSARVLHDPEGEFARFQSALVEFTWEPLQPEANRLAGATLAAQAETVHKILSGLVRGEGLYEPTAVLAMELTLAMAVKRGVMVESSASYHRQVRAAMGTDSPWSRWHQLVTGEVKSGEPSSALQMQAEAALRLYRETFRQVERDMAPDRRELAAATLAAVDQALEFPK